MITHAIYFSMTGKLLPIPVGMAVGFIEGLVLGIVYVKCFRDKK